MMVGNHRRLLAKSGLALVLVGSAAASAQAVPEGQWPRDGQGQWVSAHTDLLVAIAADGEAGKVKVWHSSGYPLFDAAAIKAVHSYHFHPRLIDGKPVASWVHVPVAFDPTHQGAASSLGRQVLAPVPTGAASSRS